MLFRSFINCACRFTEGCSLINDGTSKRKEVKELIKKLRKKTPNIYEHIFKALDNVSSECILGWRVGKDHYSFLDNYDKNM